MEPPLLWTFHLIVQMFGLSTMDLFVTQDSTQLPRFLTQSGDPSAEGMDALQHPWPTGLLYAFPSFPLLQAILYYPTCITTTPEEGRNFLPGNTLFLEEGKEGHYRAKAPTLKQNVLGWLAGALGTRVLSQAACANH